jgi:hypothetical protein
MRVKDFKGVNNGADSEAEGKNLEKRPFMAERTSGVRYKQVP